MAARRNALNRHVAPPALDRPGAGAQSRDKRTRPASSPVVAHAADLDRLIHDRTRLAIVSALAASATLSFTELKSLLDLSDGNLSVHARKLEDAGYLTCTKGFEGRLPKTQFSLTDAGHRALRQYLDHMEAIIKHARVKGR
jgi:DNA-binding transcriptional ArsR family regulator